LTVAVVGRVRRPHLSPPRAPIRNLDCAGRFGESLLAASPLAVFVHCPKKGMAISKMDELQRRSMGCQTDHGAFAPISRLQEIV
jgi:hypothetical protein